MSGPDQYVCDKHGQWWFEGDKGCSECEREGREWRDSIGGLVAAARSALRTAERNVDALARLSGALDEYDRHARPAFKKAEFAARRRKALTNHGGDSGGTNEAKEDTAP